jgi:Protein of unknown function (DUF4232)
MNRSRGYAAGAVLAAALATAALSGCAAQAGAPTASGSGPSAPTGAGTQSVGAVTLPPPSTGAGTGSAAGANGAGTAAASPSAAASAAGGAGGATVHVAAAGTPRCHTSGLASSAFIVAGSQGMGHESLNVTLINISGHACTVYGFPGFQLRDRNHDGQATNVTWENLVPKTLITLPDGGAASATVRFDDDVPVSDEPQSGACEPSSVYLAVTPPDETTQVEDEIGGTMNPTAITVCEHGALDSSAFVPGTTGPDQ